MKSLTFSAMAHLRRHADHTGTAASTLCLVHCLLTPMLVSIFPGVLSVLPGDSLVHRILACVVVSAGTIAFIPGYRIHRQPLVLMMVAMGTPLILTVAWCERLLPQRIALLLSISGSLILITAHLLNRSFCITCNSCKDTDACQTTELP